MLFPRTKKIAQQQSWHRTKSTAFGSYNNYLFFISDDSPLDLTETHCKYICILLKPLSAHQQELVEKAFERNRGHLNYFRLDVQETSVTVATYEKMFTFNTQNLYRIMDYCVEVAGLVGATSPTNCQKCDSDKQLDAYDWNDTGRILCKKCYQSINQQITLQQHDLINENKNYGIGFVGSVIFSLPVVALWVVVAIYLELLASVGALIIGVLGMKGYDYLGGKTGVWTPYLLILSNILMVITANVLTLVVGMYQEGYSVGDALYLLQHNPDVKTAFLINIALSFVLSFFIWIQLFYTVKEQDSYIVLAEKMA